MLPSAGTLTSTTHDELTGATWMVYVAERPSVALTSAGYVIDAVPPETWMSLVEKNPTASENVAVKVSGLVLVREFRLDVSATVGRAAS